ncbi:hypothetical protein [Streptomyces mirabilis]|uniref:hypothetical protein n=1 Tax=Streptomyces mirabilis TaxID=68239 RepID=UPI00331DF5EE
MTSRSVSSWFGTYEPRSINPVQRKRVAEIVEHDLRELSLGRFPIAAEPITVPLSSYRDLLEATRRLMELQHTAISNLAPDRHGRMVALKADPADFPRFTDDEPFEMRHAADVARADVMICQSGPQFIEFNVGAGVGGMLTFELQRRFWQRVRAEADEPPLTGVDLFEQLARVITRTAAELGIAPSALLIGTLDDPGKSQRNFDLQIDLLQQFGVQARFADLRDLRELTGPAGGIANAVGVVQFSENEANARGWDMSSLVTAVKAGLTAVPSQSARLMDSKKVLALLSEGLPWMSRDDLELVRRYVPWSRVVGDRPVEWRGHRYNLPRLLIERQECFVLKGAAGLSAQEVFFGATLSDREWKDLVHEATESEYYVAQETVTPVLHPVQMMLDESGRTETVLANSVISPFCLGGVPAGCHVRFDTVIGPGPVSRDSGARLGCLLGAAR